MARIDHNLRSHSRPTRILLVDDHPLVRERLAEVLNRESDLHVCGEAEDRAQALDLIADLKPDLAIVDLSLKDSDGLELIKDIRGGWPKVIVLVVSMHDEQHHAERAVRAGASGYINKQEATKNILVAIRQVLAGETYLSHAANARIAAKTFGRANHPGTLSVENLTDRELQVFEALGRGESIQEISKLLRIDAKTVETYRGRIKEKLGLQTAHELLQYAIRWGHPAEGKTVPKSKQ